MNDKGAGRIHWSFWAIGIVALVWNVLGVVNFVVQMDPDVIASYRETERAIIVGRPAWATAGFAVAVFGGAVGCILLLFRKSVSFHVFIASLIGVAVTMVHALGVDIAFGAGEILGIVLMPMAVAAFLIWYSRLAAGKGWIS